MAPISSKKGAGGRAAELFSASGGKDGIPPVRNNIVKRLMHGELSLTVTFWTCCISIPLVGHLLFSRIIYPALNPHTWYGSTAFLAWPLLALLYGLIASLGLWRSRTGFHGNPLWRNLAGPAAVIFAVGFTAYAVMMAASWFMLISA